jgi:hypothetical protein
MMASLVPILCAFSCAPALGGHHVDVHALMKQIRSSVEVQLPGWSFLKGGESDPGFFLRWTRDKSTLHLSCDQYDSAEEAIRGVRRLRLQISATELRPLPGVADEACYLGPYGLSGTWTAYFARRQFVCQAGRRSRNRNPHAVTTRPSRCA